MTQNTIENKQGFFALYIGQDVLKGNAKNHDKHTVTNTLLSKDWLSGQTCLELRLVSQITDEEAIEVGKIGYKRAVFEAHEVRAVIQMVKDLLSTTINSRQVADYLRSRGILLPFKDLSVEQILAYGWAQIKP